MQNKILLVEYDAGYVTDNETLIGNYIKEDKEFENLTINGISHTVFAILQKYGVLNNNKRIYSEEILKREAEKYKKNHISQKTSLFEANHPESTQINILNGAGLLVDCWWEGITLLGKIKLNLSKGFIDNGIVSTSGDHIANLMVNGVKVGVSSRGVGTLKSKNGVNHVQEDFDLICWDFVSQPSSRGSWVSSDYKDLTQYVESEIKNPIKEPIQHKKTAYTERLENFLSKFK